MHFLEGDRESIGRFTEIRDTILELDKGEEEKEIQEDFEEFQGKI